MLFQIYGSTSATQLLGWVLVFAGLIIMNEIGRRTKAGGILIFVIIPIILTVYFIGMHLGAFGGASNTTMEYMDGWFHYFKLYAADIGCVGFMMIKYKWGIGAKDWFKPFPWLIVAANIMIAVVSDLESAVHAFAITGDLSGAWWASNEGVFLYGGWWNVLNAIAGLINIFCMTGCGVALLLAPTFANALWNKGGWIQNRANTLAIWCMFAQVFPLFQLSKTFSVLPSVYGGAAAKGYSALDLYDKAIAVYNSGVNTSNEVIADMGITANPTAQGVVSILALVANVICISVIIKRSIEQKKNPYKNDIWVGTRDYEQAMARAAK